MRQRRYRPRSTRDRILDELKRAMFDSISPGPRFAPSPCPCDDCRIARARDISENPRVLTVQPADYDKMIELAAARQLNERQLTSFTLKMFGRVPVLLREIEAAAIIAHLERGDF